MNLIVLLCCISVTFGVAKGRSRRSADSELGEPLYLTEKIKNGGIKQAQKLALVQHPDLPIKNYAGYFTVNETFNSNMFFSYFPAKENPKEAPVLLWLEGGPGVPSIRDMFYNGPYEMTETGKIFQSKYSWHQNHHLLYIDNPVGAGYSFTDADEGYSKNQVDVSQNLLSALHQFFVMFPKLQENEFFAGGVSYGGKYVPAISYAIHQDNKRTTDDPMRPKINLKGLFIDSGWVDPINQINYADYLYQFGLIDSHGHERFVQKQNQLTHSLTNRDFETALRKMDELLMGWVYSNTSLYFELTGSHFYHDALLRERPAQEKKMSEFLVRTDARRALHVGNNTFSQEALIYHMSSDFMDSVADWVAELLSHYPVVFYNGQIDIVCAYPQTENFLKHLEFSGADEYKTAQRHVWRVDNEVAGYVKQAGNLIDIIVRNAAHGAVIYQPKFVLDILLRLTQHKGFV